MRSGVGHGSCVLYFTVCLHLCVARRLVMPLICRGMVEVLARGNNSSQNQSSLSNYAFLYGVFPTAPSVAIYASHYNMELQVVSAHVYFVLYKTESV